MFPVSYISRYTGLLLFLVPHDSTAIVALGLFFVEFSRLYIHTHTRSVRLLWKSDRPVAETSTRQHNNYKRQTYVSPTEFESSIAVKRAAAAPNLNPLNPELNPICYLLALLAHHFLHVSRMRVKSLTLRRLMSYIYIYIYIYIYMEHPFLMFLEHTQRRSTVGRTPLDE